MKEITLLFLSQNRPGDLFMPEPSRLIDIRHIHAWIQKFHHQVCTSVNLSRTHKRANLATVRMALNKKLSYDLTSLSKGSLYAQMYEKLHSLKANELLSGAHLVINEFTCKKEMKLVAEDRCAENAHNLSCLSG